jgi:tetratricopeptide (TPR) repeat protein
MSEMYKIIFKLKSLTRKFVTGYRMGYDELIARAADARRAQDYNTSIGFLEEAQKLVSSHSLNVKLANEYLLIGNTTAAKKAFQAQIDIGQSAHVINGYFGLARADIQAGQHDALLADLAALPEGWHKVDRTVTALVRAAVSANHIPWIVPFFVSYTRKLGDAPLPANLEKTLIRIRRAPDIAEMAKAFMAIEDPLTLSAAMVLAHFGAQASAQSDAREAALQSINRIADFNPACLESPLCEAARNFIPAPLEKKKANTYSLEDQLAALSQKHNSKTAIFFGQYVNPNEISRLVKNCKTVDVVPATDVLNVKDRSLKLKNAMHSAGDNVNIINLLADYGELNNASIVQLSENCDTLAGVLARGVREDTPCQTLCQFLDETHEEVDLQLSDRLFNLFRLKTALVDYLRDKKPERIILYFNHAGAIGDFMHALGTANLDCEVLVANGCANIAVGRTALTQYFTPQAAVKQTANGNTVSGDVNFDSPV